jgi:hypothetical protein
MQRELEYDNFKKKNISSFTPSQLNDIIQKRNLDNFPFSCKSSLDSKLSKLQSKARYDGKNLCQIRNQNKQNNADFIRIANGTDSHWANPKVNKPKKKRDNRSAKKSRSVSKIRENKLISRRKAIPNQHFNDLKTKRPLNIVSAGKFRDSHSIDTVKYINHNTIKNINKG